LPDEVKADAFLVAVAIGLDPGNTPAKNPVTASALGGGFGGHETPDEVTTRCAALKRCGLAMRSRSDWVRHWALSAGLTSRLGPDKAKSFGIAKETLDMNGASGWSWADIGADLSGIEFARRLRSGDISVKTIHKHFKASNAMADPIGLEDKVTPDVFKRRYKAIGSPEMNREIAKIQERVKTHFDKVTGSRGR
jgi:uncharacterized protein YfiM (DUF2279 family)